MARHGALARGHQKSDRPQRYQTCAASISSGGFGDLVPRESNGKVLAIAEALMGAVHGVFFVLVFLRGGVPTKCSPPPAADDEAQRSASSSRLARSIRLIVMRSQRSRYPA